MAGSTFSRLSAGLAAIAVTLTITMAAAPAATVSCTQPAPGPPPQLQVRGYAPATIHDTNYPIPHNALYVANNGNDTNKGNNVHRPLATIKKAISLATPGGTIVLRGGVYRESLGALPNRLTIQAYPHETPWVTGSVVLGGFTASSGVWVRSWTSPFCDTCYPSGALNAAFPAAGLPEQVFIDGAPLAQVTSRSAVVPHTFFVDQAAGQLVLGDNPSGHVVEVTQRVTALSIGTAANGTVIRGIGFRHWGNTYNGSGAVIVTGSNVTLDNDTIAWAAARGLGITTGSNDVVTNSSLIDNGMNGLTAHRANNLDFEGNEVSFSNFEHWSIAPSNFAELAGVKSTNALQSTFRANRFHDNDSNGLWFDQQSSQQVVAGNDFIGNSGHGLVVEVSGDSIVVGNVIAENGRDGLKLSGASDVRAYNDTIVDNGWAQVGVYEDSRHASTPITLANQILLAASRSVKPVLYSYDIDQPGPITTLQMITSDDNNLWGRTDTTRLPSLVYAQTASTECTTYPDLPTFSSATNRELASVSADGQPLTNTLVDPANGNYTVASGARLPTPASLPADVAAAWGTGTTVSHVGAR